MNTPRIAPCLWFDGKAEDAARFYCSVFPDSRITGTTRYGEAGREQHGQQPGTVLTVAFELGGQPFTALNGGPLFRFSEAISFEVPCTDQAEIDRYWDALLAGGGQEGPCGWLKDRFGLSWQVVPDAALALFDDDDQDRAARATVVETHAGRVVPATRPHALEACVRAMFTYDPVATLSRVLAPIVALVASDDDTGSRAQALAAVSAARESTGRSPVERVSFGHDGHNLMRYRPVEVASAIVSVSGSGR